MTDGFTLPAVTGLCADPVFVIGSPRSGTTALATALGTHPSFWVSKESYFVQQVVGDGGRLERIWRDNVERVTPSWIRHEQVGLDEFLAHLGLGLNALYSSRSGGRRWIDHTPRYTPIVEELARMFPGARFLHILRDGRDVVHSMTNFGAVFTAEQKAAATHEIPAWIDDVDRAVATWAEYARIAMAFDEARPDRCLRVLNHELSQRPEEGFAAILAFLGAEPDPGPARQFGGSRVNTSFVDGRDDADRDRWPPDLRRRFVEQAGDVLVAAGFADRSELEAWSGA